MATGLRQLIVLSIASSVCLWFVWFKVCPLFVQCLVCPCPVVYSSTLVWTWLVFGLTLGLTQGRRVAFWYPSGSKPTRADYSATTGSLTAGHNATHVQITKRLKSILHSPPKKSHFRSPCYIQRTEYNSTGISHGWAHLRWEMIKRNREKKFFEILLGMIWINRRQVLLPK